MKRVDKESKVIIFVKESSCLVRGDAEQLLENGF
jgi:hypothetical protein